MSEEGESPRQFVAFPFAAQVLPGFAVERLTPAERDAIEAYALTGYERINAALRGATAMTSDIAGRIANIRSGLTRYRLPQTVRVTREVDAWVLGIDLTDPGAVRRVVGDYFTEPGFLSTSGLEFPPRSTRHIDPIILELLVPEGTPALRLGDLAEIRDEHEVLVIDATTYLAIGALRDHRRSMWRIEAIVVEEET